MEYLNFIFKLYAIVLKKISEIKIPKKLRPIVLNTVAKVFFKFNKKDFLNLDKNIDQYKNIKDLFTRKLNSKKLKPGRKKIISPCEGKIIEFGKVDIINAKKIYYSLDNLVLNKKLKEKYKNGSFVNIYLAPNNYHRFHMPISGIIKNKRHIKGTCFPVNKWGRNISGLYTKNERYIVDIKGGNISICFIAIAASGVSNIKIKAKKNEYYKKAYELGYFNLGSTIILISDNKNTFKNIKIKNINALENLI
jgi:phosphatidylserine decarboxylase